MPPFNVIQDNNGDYIVGGVRHHYKGYFSRGATYAEHDAVTYNGRLYFSLVASNTGNAVTDGTKWENEAALSDVVVTPYGQDIPTSGGIDLSGASEGDVLTVDAEGNVVPLAPSGGGSDIALDDRRAFRKKTLTVPSEGALPAYGAAGGNKDVAPWGTWDDDDIPQFTFTEEGVYQVNAFADASGAAFGAADSVLSIALYTDDWQASPGPGIPIPFDKLQVAAISRTVVVSPDFTGVPSTVELNVWHNAGSDRDIVVALYIVKLV